MALSAASLHEGEQGAHATAATHEEGRHMASQTQVSDRRPCNLSWPTLLKDRRALVARLILRCPVVVYRLGFGWLLGHQFLLLTHVGRRTGRVRETVLKVLHDDPSRARASLPLHLLYVQMRKAVWDQRRTATEPRVSGFGGGSTAT